MKNQDIIKHVKGESLFAIFHTIKYFSVPLNFKISAPLTPEKVLTSLYSID